MSETGRRLSHYPAEGGTKKMKKIKIDFRARWFVAGIKIRLNPKDEPLISKIEQVMGIFLIQVEAKSQFP